MDIFLNIKSFSEESIHACIAACEHVDRACQNTSESYALDLSVLKENAGLTLEPEHGSRDALIVQGAFEWLQEFHDIDKTFSLSNTSVKALHRKLFKYSPRDDGTRGNYRTDIDDDMRSLFEKTKNALARQDRHPLFVISLFRVAFINLMPFITGNAQCANMLTYALLIENTYPHVSQLPLIASLNNPSSNYLRDPLVLLPDALYHLLKTYTISCTQYHPPHTYLNSRRQLLLACINKYAPLKISDIMSFFPDQSRNTIKKDLIFLKEKCFILSSGERRGMVYFAGGK